MLAGYIGSASLPHRYLPADAFAVLDRAEQYRTGEGVEEHQQKHAEDDEERFAHRHTDGKH